MCFRSRTEVLAIDQLPGSSATRRSSLPALMLRQANLCVHSRTDIEAITRLALQNVNGWHIKDLVDLVGIEPTTSSMP